MKSKQIEFSKLKHCYLVVKNFIESEGYVEIDSLGSKLDEDLGFSGDDITDLLEKFIQKFELDYSDFDYKKHFYSEGEIFNNVTYFFSLLNLSIWLPLKVIELITLNKLSIEKPQIRTLPDREVSDLTFRQMIQWYVEKKYQTESIKYEIINSQTDA